MLTWKDEWVMLCAAQAAGGGGARRGSTRKVQGDACWPTVLVAMQEIAPNCSSDLGVKEEVEVERKEGEEEGDEESEEEERQE